MHLPALTRALALLALLPLPAAATCYRGVHIFQARATTEPQHLSVSDVPTNATLAAIPDSLHTRLVYPANTTIPLSSNLGTASLSAQVHAYHAECPDAKIVLVGFSQGAMVIGNAMTGGVEGVPAFGEGVKRNIVGIILYGDPQRQGGQSYGRDTCDTDGGGLREGAQAALFNTYAPVLLSYCDKDDPVCCRTGNDWIHHVTYFTQENGAEVAAFVRANYERSLRSAGTGGSGSAGTSGEKSNVQHMMAGFIPTQGLTAAPAPPALRFVRQHAVILGVVGLFFALHVASRARWRRVYLRLP